MKTVTATIEIDATWPAPTRPPSSPRGGLAWPGTVIAAAGLVIGIPLGIVTGCVLWLTFARQLSAVLVVAVPVGP